MNNKIVLVTGAANGIGLSIAAHFLSQGAWVALNDRTPERVDSGLEKLSQAGDGPVLGCPADVTVASEVGAMVSRIIGAWGKIDILVNNAGIYPGRPFLEISEAEWDCVLDINLKGTFLVSQAVARHMVKDGVQGQIINISSGSYHSAREGSAHYCASKAGGIMLTKVMAMELARYGIRVNAVAPGMVEVDSMAINPAYVEATLRQVPAGRLGRPDDIAEVVYKLAAIDTDYLTGAVIAVDGGLALGRYGIPSI